MDIKKYTKETLEFISIRNRNFFEVTLCSLGASIYEISYHFVPMTMTTRNVKDFLSTSSYYGKTIGRVAGRISNGLLVLNNQYYRLAQNENNNVLHGGYFGISSQTFSSTIIEHEDKVIVEYRHTSYDLTSGFPGTINLLVRYIVKEKEDNLRVEFEATSDKDTVLNLTNHAYFSLGEVNNYNLKLTANVNKYIYPDDKNLLPLFEKDVDERFDFKNGLKFIDHIFDKELVDVKANGYDHMLIIDKKDNHLLSLESSKYILDVYSSYDCVQIYSDNIIDNIKMKGTENIHHRSVAIEPQKHQLGDITLKFNDVYNHYIEYNFRRK